MRKSVDSVLHIKLSWTTSISTSALKRRRHQNPRYKNVVLKSCSLPDIVYFACRLLIQINVFTRILFCSIYMRLFVRFTLPRNQAESFSVKPFSF